MNLFSELPAAEHKALTRAARTRACKKGEVLFLHGDAAAHVYVVVSGAVKLHRQTPQGKDITLQIAIAGDLIGERDMLEDKKNYQMAATVAEECTLLEYPVWFIRQALQECPHFALNMLTALSRSSRRNAIDGEHLLTLKAPQRVGCFLLRLCDMHALDPKRFTLPYNKSTIASKLGMEPESFSRALAKLKSAGVSVSGNEVSIQDIVLLNDYVCGDCSVAIDCETCENLHAHSEPEECPRRA